MGPYRSEPEVLALPVVREAYAAAAAEHATGRRGALGEHNRRMLLGAAELAGVELGEYDRRIIEWLAGWEPQTCAVIAGLITRGAEARAPQNVTAAAGAENQHDAPAICGHGVGAGGVCGLIPLHSGQHRPVHVVTADPGASGERTHGGIQ